MNGFNHQRGISLVEILVALVISVFLLAGIVQVYLGNKSTFSFTNALAEVQENGRFALDLMSQDLRLAAEWGCMEFDPDHINNTVSAATLAGYDADFHDFTGEESIEGSNNDGPLNNSDTLTIRGGKPGQTNVEGPFYDMATAQLTVGLNTSIGAGDIVLIARCGKNDSGYDSTTGEYIEADIQVVTAATETAIETELDLASTKSQQFENDAIVVELQTVNYFVDDGASGEPALFRREFDAAAQELVEGVEDMQILFGVDTDNDDFPNQYLTADAVADFDDVVTVRIMLLMRSIDDFVVEESQTYTFNGATVTPGDRRLRQVFSTTVALRNRIGSI